MRRAPARAGLVAALLAALVLPGCSSGSGPGSAGLHGAVLDQQYVAPTQSLTDTDGEPYSLATDTDKPLTLVFFGYTRCPDICNVVLATLASALTRLDEQERERVDVVFVTTDPTRDDAEAIRTYLDRFDPSFIGLTGELRTIVDVARPLKVAVEKGRRLPSGGYEVTHNTHVSAIAADDRVPILWTQGTSAAQYADDIHTLLGNQERT